jgi:type IV pilus assembly protein PilB
MNTENITTTQDQKIGEILIEEGLINEAQLQDAYQAQHTSQTYKPIGQILVDQKLITQKQLNYLLDRNWKRARLGDILVRSGVITKDLIDIALSKQKESGIRLGEELVKQNFLSEKVMRQVLCTQLNIPYVNLDDIKIDRRLVKLINKNYAFYNHIVPVAKIGSTMTLAMDDPTCSWLVGELEAMTGLTVNVVTSTRSAIKNAFSRLYEQKELADTGVEIEIIEDETDTITETELFSQTQTRKTADSLVPHIINQALKRGASDIHIESGDRRLSIRYRIDGVLKEPFLGTLQDDINKTQKEIISRIKIIAKLDISERRRPQDGSFRARIMKAGKSVKIDFRVSIVPGYYGENIVIRILDSRNAPKSLDQLGFSKKITAQFHQLLKRNEGLILITGPTGCGKSTTLYGALMSLYRPGIKILTAENPIEYVYDNISQCQVDEKIGNTFANYIRAFLRQDPEVIMVGEIRDSETAQMALRAAQTGHMVLSTLHTNDTYSSILRLFGLKVDSNLIASSLIGVLSQRLVRQICPHCKEEYNPPDELLKEFFGSNVPKIKWYRGRKCSSCNYMGYLGRIGVSQLWSPSDNDILLINKRLLEELRESSDRSTIFMVEDAMTLLNEGKTNLEELIRTLPYSCIFQFHKQADHHL